MAIRDSATVSQHQQPQQHRYDQQLDEANLDQGMVKTVGVFLIKIIFHIIIDWSKFALKFGHF